MPDMGITIQLLHAALTNLFEFFLFKKVEDMDTHTFSQGAPKTKYHC